MDESQYQALADKALRHVQDALDSIDSELCDCERAGDVVTLTFASGLRCVLNTQRPTRQLWLAARTTAWHFSYDATRDAWLDDKGKDEELYAQIAAIVQREASATLQI